MMISPLGRFDLIFPGGSRAAVACEDKLRQRQMKGGNRSPACMSLSCRHRMNFPKGSGGAVPPEFKRRKRQVSGENGLSNRLTLACRHRVNLPAWANAGLNVARLCNPPDGLPAVKRRFPVPVNRPDGLNPAVKRYNPKGGYHEKTA